MRSSKSGTAFATASANDSSRSDSVFIPSSRLPAAGAKYNRLSCFLALQRAHDRERYEEFSVASAVSPASGAVS
jgi:hypothetical protein